MTSISMLRPFGGSASTHAPLVLNGTGNGLRIRPCPARVMGHFQHTPEVIPHLDCGRLKVPLNHLEPGATGKINVAFVRIRAPNQAERIGVLNYNPGGPGGSPLQSIGFFNALCANSDGPMRELAEKFDWLGIQPRGFSGEGITKDQGVQCSANGVLQTYNDVAADRSDANLEKAESNLKLIAEAALSDKRSAWINTEQTTHDFNAVRKALGEPLLHGLYISYGSMLGAYFHALFPHATGRMVFDSSMLLPADMDTNFGSSASEAQDQFEQLVATEAAKHPAIYGSGDTPEKVVAQLRRLEPKVVAAIRAEILEGPEALMAGQALSALLRQTPGIELAAASLEFNKLSHSSDPRVQARVLAYGKAAIERYFSPLGSTYPANLPSSMCTRVLIRCGDTPSKHDPAYWRARGDWYAAQFPAGGADPSLNPCAYWQGAVANKPDLIVALANSTKILFTHPEFDLRTPLKNIEQLRYQIPGLDFVVAQGQRGHGAFGEGNDCVDYMVASYLVNGTRPSEPGEGAVTFCMRVKAEGSARSDGVEGGDSGARQNAGDWRAQQVEALRKLLREELRQVNQVGFFDALMAG